MPHVTGVLGIGGVKAPAEAVAISVDGGPALRGAVFKVVERTTILSHGECDAHGQN